MTDPKKPVEEEFEEISEVQDDAVIGRALRRSLIVLVVLAVLVGAVVFLVGNLSKQGPEVAIDAQAPQQISSQGDSADRALALPFTDISDEAEVFFLHVNGAYGDKLLPESMGGGAAFFDFDGDGDQDLLLTNGAPWPHRLAPAAPATLALYRNEQNEDGRFFDVTAAVGLDRSFYGTGVAVGDYDNDGDPDVFLTAVGENHLFRNDGGRFAEVTPAAGVAGAPDAWSTSAGFFDYDNDGDLDLFVGNYVQWSKEIDFAVDYRLTGVGRAYGPPVNYAGSHSYLYRNEGDGTFTDVSAAAGIEVSNPATGEPAGKALGLGPIDVDGDGWMDLLVANDTVGNFFFHNQGDGTFTEEGTLYGLAYGRGGEATGAMGVDSGYFRNDGEVGMVIGNFANEMTSVYVSQGDPTIYADEAIAAGIGAPSRTRLTFGLFLFDADLDGRLDLLQANGHLEDEINQVDPSQSYPQPAQLFLNLDREGRSVFAAVPTEATGDLGDPIVGRGAAYADIDGDGDLDVVLTQTGGPPLLLRNNQETGHHWLRVKLQGDPAQGVNRDAIGAWVEVTAGGVTQRRQVMPTKSYQSQVELPVTFGLGENETVESLTVIWPGGTRQEVPVPGVDRVVGVAQGL